MTIPKRQDQRLKLGNFFLASIFSLVPTAMTIGFLGVHGYILCRTLDQRIEQSKDLGIKELCNRSNIDTNYDYIFWIWLFTMIPTWRWFYIGHYKKVSSKEQK